MVLEDMTFEKKVFIYFFFLQWVEDSLVGLLHLPIKGFFQRKGKMIMK